MLLATMPGQKAATAQSRFARQPNKLTHKSIFLRAHNFYGLVSRKNAPPGAIGTVTMLCPLLLLIEFVA